MEINVHYKFDKGNELKFPIQSKSYQIKLNKCVCKVNNFFT